MQPTLAGPWRALDIVAHCRPGSARVATGFSGNTHQGLPRDNQDESAEAADRPLIGGRLAAADGGGRSPTVVSGAAAPVGAAVVSTRRRSCASCCRPRPDAWHARPAGRSAASPRAQPRGAGIDEIGLSANALPKKLAVPVNRVTMILNGQRSVASHQPTGVPQRATRPRRQRTRMARSPLRLIFLVGVTGLLAWSCSP